MTEQKRSDMRQERIVNEFATKYFFNKVFTKVETVQDRERQSKGIDLIADGIRIDVKAQSSPRYINNPTKTFILELSFLNSNLEEMQGWFIDKSLLTDMYAFIWIPKADAIGGRMPGIDFIKEMEIMLIDKHKVKHYINQIYPDATLMEMSQYMRQKGERRLSSSVDGIHFSHTPTLFEKPSNIVAQKEFLKQFAIKHCMVTSKTITDIT